MNDKPKIILGLIVLVAAVTFPFWNGLIAKGEPPALVYPENEDSCVMDKDWMIANHMNLLDTWRNDVVRKGPKYATITINGKTYEKSLTKTCMSANCHANRAAFCDKCHTYADVTPYCWDCHVTPDQVKGKGD